MKTFKKATKHALKLRLALVGVSGGGKTYTALNIAKHLVPGGRVAVIDTERESAAHYSDRFDFEVCALENFHPGEYIEAIQSAESAGFDVIVIDSLSHAWSGTGGLLDEVNKSEARSGGKFKAWGPASELQNKLIDTITKSKCHIICTMRTKMEHVIEDDDRGRKVVRKVGMKVIQRDDVEYEFTLYATMDRDNRMIVEKSRCDALSGKVIAKPGKEVADILSHWLSSGGPAPTLEEPQPKAPTPIRAVASEAKSDVDWDTRLSEAKMFVDACESDAEITGMIPKLREFFPANGCPAEVRKSAIDYHAKRRRDIAAAAAVAATPPGSNDAAVA